MSIISPLLELAHVCTVQHLASHDGNQTTMPGSLVGMPGTFLLFLRADLILHLKQHNSRKLAIKVLKYLVAMDYKTS